MSSEEAVITLRYSLASEVEGADDHMQQYQPFLSQDENFAELLKEQVDETIKDSIDDALEDQGVDIDSLQDITQMVRDVDKKGISNITSFAKNPVGFGENIITQALSRAGPYGALVAAIIAAVLAGPELLKEIIKALGTKGGLINQDFRFSQDEQNSQEFDRRTQFQRLTGDNPVIRFENFGLVAATDGDFVGNSLVEANLARTARIGLRSSSYGYIHGI